MKKVWTILTILFCSLCIIFLVVGIFTSRHVRHLHKVCTEKTVATVTSLEEKIIPSFKDNKRKERRIYEKITYYVDGESYTKDRSITTNFDKIGDEFAINYNPNNPDEYIEINKVADFVLMYLFLIIGVVMGIIGLFFLKKAIISRSTYACDE